MGILKAIGYAIATGIGVALFLFGGAIITLITTVLSLIATGAAVVFVFILAIRSAEDEDTHDR